LSQCGERPARCREPSRFDTIPSQPSAQGTLFNTRFRVRRSGFGRSGAALRRLRWASGSRGRLPVSCWKRRRRSSTTCRAADRRRHSRGADSAGSGSRSKGILAEGLALLAGWPRMISIATAVAPLAAWRCWRRSATPRPAGADLAARYRISIGIRANVHTTIAPTSPKAIITAARAIIVAADMISAPLAH
jgi:hypothetical protein